MSYTNDNLRTASTEKTFRQDLYFRLNEFSISVPALRNRVEDILVFANFFRAMANEALKKNVSSFDADTEDILKNYSWPGNLRELKNVVKRAVLIATTDEVTKNCLPDEILYDFNPNPMSKEIDTTNLKSAAESAEIATILKVLAETGNNKTKAAQILNIDRKTLYNKLNAYKDANGKKG